MGSYATVSSIQYYFCIPNIGDNIVEFSFTDIVQIFGSFPGIKSITALSSPNMEVYVPEFGFNDIGNITMGEQATLQLNNVGPTAGWSLDIPIYNVYAIEVLDGAEFTIDFNEIPGLIPPPPVPGCMDASMCNYNSAATVDDGSCYNNDVGCGCDNPAPAEGEDCQGNLIPVPGCMDPNLSLIHI